MLDHPCHDLIRCFSHCMLLIGPFSPMERINKEETEASAAPDAHLVLCYII